MLRRHPSQTPNSCTNLTSCLSGKALVVLRSAKSNRPLETYLVHVQMTRNQWLHEKRSLEKLFPETILNLSGKTDMYTYLEKVTRIRAHFVPYLPNHALHFRKNCFVSFHHGLPFRCLHFRKMFDNSSRFSFKNINSKNGYFALLPVTSSLQPSLPKYIRPPRLKQNFLIFSRKRFLRLVLPACSNSFKNFIPFAEVTAPALGPLVISSCARAVSRIVSDNNKTWL